MSILLFVVLVLLILNPSIVSEQVFITSSLWLTVLLPAMYPSLVCIDLLAQMPLISKLSKALFPLFRTLFNIQHERSAFIIVISILCGAPASTKVVQASLVNKEISEAEGTALICAFSYLSLPYSLLVCQNFHIPFYLFLPSILLLSMIWMHLFYKTKSSLESKKEQSEIHYASFFVHSIKDNFNIILNILGIMILFRVLISLTLSTHSFLYPFLEILGGLTSMEATPYSKIIACSALGFLGFSVHLQIFSIKEDIPYFKFLGAKSFFLLLGGLGFFL